MKFIVMGKGKLPGMEPPPPPAFKTLAGNALKSVASVALAKAKGAPILRTRQEREKFLAICRGGCPWFKAAGERCLHPRCGCYMRVKTWLHALACPEGKWGTGKI